MLRRAFSALLMNEATTCRLDGALEDPGVFFRTGRAVADSGDWPEWSKHSEFRG
jgi:hypothetical protein